MKNKIITAIFTLLFASINLLSQDLSEEKHLSNAKEFWHKMSVSLAIDEWKKVLKINPKNKEATEALSKVAPLFEKSETFLILIEDLILKGLSAEAHYSLRNWQPVYMSQNQEARLFLLKGELQLMSSRFSAAQGFFLSAKKRANQKELKLKARFGLIRIALADSKRAQEGIALLNTLTKESVGSKIEDRVRWEFLKNSNLDSSLKIEQINKFIKDFPNSFLLAKAYRSLALAIEIRDGHPHQQVMKLLIEAYVNSKEIKDIEASIKALDAVKLRTKDQKDLLWLATHLEKQPINWQCDRLITEVAAFTYRRMASLYRGPIAIKATNDYGNLISTLLKTYPRNHRQKRWQNWVAESLLMEGQLLLLENNDLEAFKILLKASGHFKALMEVDRQRAGKTLIRIGRILESRGRPNYALHHYKFIAEKFLSDSLGAKAMMRLALLYRDRLDRPLEAVMILKRYQDLFPPHFRVYDNIKERIKNLKYSDVVSFQAAHGLKADGVSGQLTRKALDGEESNFREILFPNKLSTSSSKDIKDTLLSSASLSALNNMNTSSGKMVHQMIFNIAMNLKERGRFREAVLVFQEFLSMYPGHRLGDDSLFEIGTIFLENDLFNEALSCFNRLLLDYPKGNQTSHAYIDAAICHENLGQWKKAGELYALYLKKFPRYRRAGEARNKLKHFKKIIRFAELVAENDLQPGKMADALYEMAKIIYAGLGNKKKAIELFSKVANNFKKSHQAPDARFTAGVCLLHEGNFDQARDTFKKLIEEFPESRLADDAQYWIGHTFEYQARDLGKLDFSRVIIKKRSIVEVSILRNDLRLRKTFWKKAKAVGPAWHQPHPDLLSAGQTREKVVQDLLKAIQAYKLVVEKHRLGDMAQKTLLRIGIIYGKYLNDPEKAIQAYQELLEKYPGSTEAVNAQFEVGQHYLTKGNYVKAEKAINLFLTSFPNHSKAEEALLNLAECHSKQKEWLKALDDYKSFTNRYKNSNKIKEVKEKIEWIKKYRF